MPNFSITGKGCMGGPQKTGICIHPAGFATLPCCLQFLVISVGSFKANAAYKNNTPEHTIYITSVNYFYV